MKFLQRLFPSPEVRGAREILDELSRKFETTFTSRQAFQLVRRELEEMITADPKKFATILQKQGPMRSWIFGAVGNIAGDHAESGRYHSSAAHGMFDPIGPGADFVRIHDAMIDELTRLGVHTSENASKIKVSLYRNVKSAG